MINRALSELDRERAAAEAEAAAVLSEQGFIPLGGKRWQGTLDCHMYGPLSVWVTIPPSFPDSLPEVRVDCAALGRCIPHVEHDGKVCISPMTGITLDSANPRGLMVETLQRAQRELIVGLSGTNVQDFLAEFDAYWSPGTSGTVWSICSTGGVAHPIYEACLAADNHRRQEHILLADTLEGATTWAAHAGRGVLHGRQAYFVPLGAPLLPHWGDTPLTIGDVLMHMHQSAPDAYRAFKRWLNGRSLPATVVLAMPGSEHDILAVVRFERPPANVRHRSERGFRPGNCPPERQLWSTASMPVTRFRVERLDPGFVLVRGGATSPLLIRTVTVVGCGAIGSHLAERLASLGVGGLRLIDPDRLSSENIHRHVLGVEHISSNKAVALAQALGRRFPHLAFDARPQSIEDVLRVEADWVLSTDLIVIAVGDDTVELRLNDLLHNVRPRLHVWIEPLGVGGHVLLTGQGLGCFRCLFARDAQIGLYNQAAFTAPGQAVYRSYAGCAGVFIPYAGIDADRAALEAANLAARVLGEQEKANRLVSWRGDPAAFLAAGFQLSPRAQVIGANQLHVEHHFSRDDCPVCTRETDALPAAA